MEWNAGEYENKINKMKQQHIKIYSYYVCYDTTITAYIE